MARRYFTTPIYYVNDRPHIGHLYTTVVTDALARFHRFEGDEVRFLTGTDEHGQKIEKVARAEGVTPIDVCNRHVETFRALWRKFGITNDDFIRTSDAKRHHPGVVEIIRRIDAAGDLEIRSHEGWYCVGCEAFYPEKDLVDGACPTHGYKPEWQSEENVFFRLDRYQGRLLELYDAQPKNDRPSFVFPPSRLNEVRSFVASGLKPLSVSRTSVKWGIPFPSRPGHVVYVWLDALTNYISALGFGTRDDRLYRTYWPGGAGDPQAFHLVGKDILRFHAVYWPAFLMSAGLPVPTQVISHGWWERDGRKMSKSVGNVVRPDELVDHFGVDALRWFLLAEMSFGQDASFSDEGFLSRYNADLANGLGNTLARAVRMASDAFGGKTPSERCNDNEVKNAARTAVGAWRAAFSAYRFQEAADAIRALVTAIDAYIAAREPWKKVKTDGVTPALHRIHFNALEGLRIAAVLLSPIAPVAAAEILRRIGAPREVTALRSADLEWGGLLLEAPLDIAFPLFPRADAKSWFQPAPPKERTVTEETKPTVQAGEPASASPAAPAVPAAFQAAVAAEVGPKIPIEEFLKVDIRIGEVVAAEKVEKSKKLMRMTVRFGDEVRTIVGGIATAYTADQLVGKKFAFVHNLAPAKLMGIESNGMILAASLPGTGEPSLLQVDPAVPSGTKVK
jgi:methionyl-tRNA synthetase